MIKIKQTILVEGKYDKSKLASIFTADILTTDGFAIFRDKQRLEMLRRIAARDGLIILTDSDGAGFKIRAYIGGAIPKEQITHIYIPDVLGKERRKEKPSAEGKLGVEGLDKAAIVAAFMQAGVVDLQDSAQPGASQPSVERYQFSTADFYQHGLCGAPSSRQKRAALAVALSLPSRLSTSALLTALSRLCSYEDFLQKLKELD